MVFGPQRLMAFVAIVHMGEDSGPSESVVGRLKPLPYVYWCLRIGIATAEALGFQ